MSELGTLAKPCVHLGRVDRLRLPELYDIEEQASVPCWNRQDFLAASQSDGAGVAIAEVHGRTIGFALYKAAPPAKIGLSGINRLLCYLPWRRAAPASPLYIDLLRIAVLPEWQRQGAGRALLGQLHQDFAQGVVIQAVVRERDLPVQLFLRDAGYKAVRILRSHYGSEDGYFMEKLCG
jgi:ribosomal protein S18 acetylase RimI-like enzyme